MLSLLKSLKNACGDWLSVAIAAVSISAVSASTLVSLIAHASEWAQYRGPLADGTTSERIPIPWPESGPRQLWKVPVNGGFSSFAVSSNRAFTLVIRTNGGVKMETCVVLDADSGQELWATPLAVAKYDGGGDSGAPGTPAATVHA